MTSRRVAFLLLVPLLPVACGGSTADFGAVRTLPADQRPTQWDLPLQKRLYVEEMKGKDEAKKPPLPTRYTGTTPGGWETQPGQPARFRDLVWRIAGDASTECYFTARTGGGVVMNLNRWYGQFGMPVAAAETLPAVELAGRQGRLLELAGTYNGKPSQGMMLAFLADGEDVTTLKFTGPEAVVKTNREAFLGLCKSMRPEGEPSAGPGQTDENKPPMPPVGHGPGTAADAPFLATAPTGWTPKTSPRPLHYTFGSDAEVYVAMLSGEPGPMFDIWRGEVGLTTPLTDDEKKILPKLPLLGGDAVLLDVRGDYQSMSGKKIAGARLLVAMRAEGGAITFVKLVGKQDEVEKEVEAFRSFCAALRRAP